MTMWLLTITGVLSIALMIRSITISQDDDFFEGVVLGVFGFISFILTIILTNGVAP